MQRMSYFPRVVLSLLAPVALGACQFANAQMTKSNEWTPVAGKSTTHQPGVYGSQGIPSADNVPGSRSGAASWSDANGNLWMFGGFGVPSTSSLGNLNDLWKYDSAANQWTWVSGSNAAEARGSYGTLGTAAASNVPGARFNAAAQTDKSGNFWLFGGYGADSAGTKGLLNDVWEFNATTRQWTWKGGGNITAASQAGSYGTLGVAAPTNIPGARQSVASWIDAGGKFWFFGGQQFDSKSNTVYLSDLWSFDPATSQWTWAAGPQAGTGKSAVYGTLGKASPANLPGGRTSAATWVDASGNLWLFGGQGLDSNGTTGYLSDLWKFDTASGQWAWMGGSNLTTRAGCSAGTYGSVRTASSAGLPGGRTGSTVWTDSYGRFWMFGGFGCDSNGRSGNLGDLWMFSTSKNQWTWMGGSNTANPVSVQGALGVASPTNMPGGRSATAAWTGTDGRQWLFGGSVATNNQLDVYGDLWSFQPPTPDDGGAAPAVITSPTNGSALTGTSTTFNWSTGTDVSFYSLWVGTKGAGSRDIYDSGNLFTPTATVSGLPSNGQFLYVRLFSWIGSGWQSNDYIYTASGSSDLAALNSPAPGSVLPGTSASFGWTKGNNVTLYSLWLGTTGPGSRDVFNSGNLTTQSVTVSTLPNTGQYIYARLFSWLNGAWQSNDYLYTASGTPAAATMTTPAPGSTLSGSSTTFNWSQGSGAIFYSLWVGTQGPGSRNVLDSGNISGLSKAVSGMPTGGQTVYVRLFSWINGAFRSNDYTYTASGTASPATMTTPAPASTLPGASATFNWSAGTGVQFYSLWVGTQGVGSRNIYNSGNTNARFATVSGLPENGQTVYVRLFSWINGAWQTNDYTYTASAPPQAAVLTSPAPGSTLSGSSVTFGWSKGVAVQFYSLWVGTTGVGSNNIFDSGNTFNQSANVSGIPTAGQTIYVRLYSWIDGAWQTTDATYTAQ